MVFFPAHHNTCSINCIIARKPNKKISRIQGRNTGQMRTFRWILNTLTSARELDWKWEMNRYGASSLIKWLGDCWGSALSITLICSHRLLTMQILGLCTRPPFFTALRYCKWIGVLSCGGETPSLEVFWFSNSWFGLQGKSVVLWGAGREM